jgi:hypothetical protein
MIDCEAMIGHWDETASFVAALPEIFIMILVLIFPDEDPFMSTIGHIVKRNASC